MQEKMITNLQGIVGLEKLNNVKTNTNHVGGETLDCSWGSVSGAPGRSLECCKCSLESWWAGGEVAAECTVNACRGLIWREAESPSASGARRSRPDAPARDAGCCDGGLSPVLESRSSAPSSGAAAVSDETDGCSVSAAATCSGLDSSDDTLHSPAAVDATCSAPPTLCSSSTMRRARSLCNHIHCNLVYVLEKRHKVQYESMHKDTKYESTSVLYL